MVTSRGVGIHGEAVFTRLPAFTLLVILAVGCTTGSAQTEVTFRAPLDTVWNERMLDGASVIMAFRNSRIDMSNNESRMSFTSADGKPESAARTNMGIAVMRLGEGVWGNGGWILEGGLLAKVLDGISQIELYGKAVVRQLPYFPLPFHRAVPHETGYEFFLLHRPRLNEKAVVVHKWVFGSDEVVTKNLGGGLVVEDVRGTLQYDAKMRVARVMITGLKRVVEERIEIGSYITTPK